MITESDAYRRSDRLRLLWSFLASTALNVLIAAVLSAQFASSRYVRTEQPRERLVVLSSSIRIEHRSIARPRIRQAETLPPQGALSVPRDWDKQDFGNIAETSVTLWLDWTKQTASFVPRLFLWQKKEDPEMPRPSLQDAVQDVLSTLHNEDDKVYASNAQRVCGGKRPGWFFSYVKPGDDPPLHFEETLLVAGGTIYRATYIRPAGQPEDPKARDALNTLC